MTTQFFTANFGGFDTFKKQPFLVNYYNEANAHFPMYTQDNRMKAKFYKMLSNRVSDADLLGWIDGNVQIKEDSFPDMLVNALGDADIVISKHPSRQTPVEESMYIANQITDGNKYLVKRYEYESIVKEVKVMGSYANKSQLYWCGLFLRRNTAKVNAAFEDWFMDNVLWTNFDQNSFSKIVIKHRLKVATIDFGSFYDNDHYSITKHLK
jgi:hypothetical protein